MTRPPYAVEFRGLPACECQVEWIPELERRLRLVLPQFQGTLAIAQMIGLYEKSGNTHGDPRGRGLRKGGGFTDFWVTGALADLVVREARQMGAPATWRRPKNWDGKGGSEHVHSGLEGCPHATEQGLAQITAVYANGDGLVGDAPDSGPRPIPHRTWREGIAWARAQEDDMPAPKDWTKADWDAFNENAAPAIAKVLLDAETVELRKADGTRKPISVRSAVQRILNPDES